MRWVEMTVTCAPESVDAVSYAFLQAGCGGVAITGENPLVVTATMPVTDLVVSRTSHLRRHLSRLPEFGLPGIQSGIAVRYIDDADWANAWKAHFRPTHIGERLIVKPSWEPYQPAPGELVIDLDPGMAFGTGGHPTTRLCMEALEQSVGLGMNVADMGTGSGILSITAALLGAACVCATEIDPLPRQIATENVKRNGLGRVIKVFRPEELPIEEGQFDLIVSNIVAATIIELTPEFALRLKPEGVLITCGIVEEQAEEVRQSLTRNNLAPVRIMREDIWVCYISRKAQPCGTSSSLPNS